MNDPIRFHGYQLVFASSAGVQEGRYHDSASVTLQIAEEATGEVVHVLTRTSRSSHQLSKRPRPATVDTDVLVSEAEAWILAHRPDARARVDAEREAVRARNLQWRHDKLTALGGDLVAYAVETAPSLSATEVGEALGLGSARRLNLLLVEWGLLTKTRDGYALVDDTLGDVVGEYGTVRWNGEGLKAIWDAAVARGVVNGGDAAFVDRLRTNKAWFTVA